MQKKILQNQLKFSLSYHGFLTVLLITKDTLLETEQYKPYAHPWCVGGAGLLTSKCNDVTQKVS